MNPRTSILNLFSTFAYLEGDNFRHWVADARLRQSIQRCVAFRSSRSEGLWSVYWFQQIQLQFRVSQGEQFEIEIACCGQILKERFGR